ncbi:hypothetical protein BDZ45DRAFT_697686 [Acephala macrosclerotiorum]|nr:hypothetical protein BDZ45DRAFT_697686 [Acephala macrosclerotiorum]
MARQEKRTQNSQNQRLERSLERGETKAQEEYNAHFARLGRSFAVGNVLPELPDMLSSSEGTSRGAVRTMTVKYQRMMQARGPIHRELSSSQRRSGYTSAGFGSPASDRGRVPGEERAREKKASRSLGYSAVRLGVMRSRKNGPCASHLENSTTWIPYRFLKQPSSGRRSES